jgi:hypothetical protein
VTAAKAVRYPTDDGPVSIQTRAYRRWKRLRRAGQVGPWEGVDVVDVATAAEAQEVARGGDTSVGGRVDTSVTPPPTLVSTPSLYTSFPSYTPYKYIRGVGSSKAPTFVCLSIEGFVSQNPDPAFRLWAVVAAYARWMQRSEVRLTQEVYRLAHVRAGRARTRTLSRVEANRWLKIQRPVGRCPIATVNTDRNGYAVPFPVEDSP